MLRLLKLNWKRARGSVLKQEFVDLVTRLECFTEAEQESFDQAFIETIKRFVTSYGEIINVKRSTCEKAAKAMTSEAKALFDSNPARAHGIVMVAMLLESYALPGEDAFFVKTSITEFLQRYTND